jgi:uncharacterized protein YjbI with pentapeptide repeats
MDLIGKFGSGFSGLDLSGVDFRGAHTVGLETNLRGADFTNANLQDARFGAAVLDGADFTGADLRDASFVTASLRGVILEDVNVQGTGFYQSDLSQAKMANIDLSQSDITGSSFPGADLSGSILAGAKNEYWGLEIQGADLSNADLQGSMLSGAGFQRADLRSADLSDCQLEQADFTGAHLQGANLDNVQVEAAVFRNVQGLGDTEKRKLTRAARRWSFDLKTATTAFLNSPAFPVFLLLGVPLVAAVTWVAGWQRKAAPDSTAGFQFSLSSMWLWTTVICGFIGVGLWSSTAAFSYAMVCAFYMMVAEIIIGRASRKLAAGLLAAALVYAAMNVAVYAVVISADPFALFDWGFMIAAVLLGPLLALGGAVTFAIVVARSKTRFAGLALIGFCIWIVGVGFANLWVIATAAASV